MRQFQGWINARQGPNVVSTVSMKMVNLPWKAPANTAQLLLARTRSCPYLNQLEGERIRPIMGSTTHDSLLYQVGNTGQLP